MLAQQYTFLFLIIWNKLLAFSYSTKGCLGYNLQLQVMHMASVCSQKVQRRLQLCNFSIPEMKRHITALNEHVFPQTGKNNMRMTAHTAQHTKLNCAYSMQLLLLLDTGSGKCKENSLLCKIWGTQNEVCEEPHLLGCEAVRSGAWFLTAQTPHSYELLGTTHRMTWHHTAGDINLQNSLLVTKHVLTRAPTSLSILYWFKQHVTHYLCVLQPNDTHSTGHFCASGHLRPLQAQTSAGC
jgi:hypothetical protein